MTNHARPGSIALALAITSLALPACRRAPPPPDPCPKENGAILRFDLQHQVGHSLPPGPFERWEVVQEQKHDPFDSVRVLTYNGVFPLLVVWTGERYTAQALRPWAEPPGGIRAMSTEFRELTGAPPEELVFTYDFDGNMTRDKSMIVCLYNPEHWRPSCSSPLVFERARLDGALMWRGRIGFPAPGKIAWYENDITRCALLRPAFREAP